jgi:hypothetical protein
MATELIDCGTDNGKEDAKEMKMTSCSGEDEEAKK